MYCGNCGTSNPDINKFCRECGSPLTQSQFNSQPVQKELNTKEPETSYISFTGKGMGITFGILLILFSFIPILISPSLIMPWDVFNSKYLKMWSDLARLMVIYPAAAGLACLLFGLILPAGGRGFIFLVAGVGYIILPFVYKTNNSLKLFSFLPGVINKLNFINNKEIKILAFLVIGGLYLLSIFCLVRAVRPRGKISRLIVVILMFCVILPYFYPISLPFVGKVKIFDYLKSNFTKFNKISLNEKEISIVLGFPLIISVFAILTLFSGKFSSLIGRLLYTSGLLLFIYPSIRALILLFQTAPSINSAIINTVHYGRWIVFLYCALGLIAAGIVDFFEV